MTAAVTVLKSKTGRKGAKIGAIFVIALVLGTLMLATMFVTAVKDILFGTHAGSSNSISSTGTLSISFSQTEPAESAYALSHIPSVQTDPSVVTFPILYAAATQNGQCVIPWPLLAGVTNEESTFGTSRAVGVGNGSNGAGAEGPFQFEPATFAGYANPIPKFPGAALPPSVYDAVDSAFAAARKLCSDGILTDPKLALWSYNAGMNGISFVTSNGVVTPVYNDAPFAHSSDNPAKYVSDVVSNAALYGGGKVTGSDSVSIVGLAPGSGNPQTYRERSALWLAGLASDPPSCEKMLSVSCFDALPTILSNYDGIDLPYAPSEMKPDLISTSVPKAGDIVLFGDKKQKHSQVGIDDGAYAVVVDSSTNQIAMVSAGLWIIQLPGPISVGQSVDGLTVQYIGSPFG